MVFMDHNTFLQLSSHALLYYLYLSLCFHLVLFPYSLDLRGGKIVLEKNIWRQFISIHENWIVLRGACLLVNPYSLFLQLFPYTIKCKMWIWFDYSKSHFWIIPGFLLLTNHYLLLNRKLSKIWSRHAITGTGIYWR